MRRSGVVEAIAGSIDAVGYLTHMSRKVEEVIRAGGLRDDLTFTSFRHGGFTEAGDAELTDRELMAQGRHKSPKVLGKYVKKTVRQNAKTKDHPEAPRRANEARTGFGMSGNQDSEWKSRCCLTH
jgi:hypothetical protein